MKRFFAATAIVLALLFAAGPGLGQEKDAETRFNSKATETNNAIADLLARFGVDCLDRGLNVLAHKHLALALEHNPDCERAHRALCHVKKQSGGKTEWTRNQEKEPPREDAKDIKPEARAETLKQQGKLYADLARRLLDLGEFALKLELAPQARVSFDAALRYEPGNEAALKGAGWTKDASGTWISARERAEREAASKALAEPPVTREITDLPQWARDLGKADKPVSGIRAGSLSVLGSGGLHREATRYAAAARTLAAGALGGKPAELLVFLAEDQAQHEAYCTARRRDVPSLAQEKWSINDGEVELVRETEDNVTLERVVYAVGLSEVRVRCGAASHTWFELGYAGNLTHRLCERASQLPLSAKCDRDCAKWKAVLLALVESAKQPALDKVLVARDPDDDTLIHGHFFTKYLLLEHSGAIEAFCAAVKAREPMDAALKAATQLDIPRLEQAFLAWLKRGA